MDIETQAKRIKELEEQLNKQIARTAKIYSAATDLIDFELMTEFEDRIYGE